jgi:hypothetical protein
MRRNPILVALRTRRRGAAILLAFSGASWASVSEHAGLASITAASRMSRGCVGGVPRGARWREASIYGLNAVGLLSGPGREFLLTLEPDRARCRRRQLPTRIPTAQRRQRLFAVTANGGAVVRLLDQRSYALSTTDATTLAGGPSREFSSAAHAVSEA